MTHIMIAKRCMTLITCAALVISISGCSSQKEGEDDGPHYVDDQAMSTIASGFAARSEALERGDRGTTDGEYAAYVKSGVQAEIDVDTALKAAPFEDSKLQENVLAYINLLDDSIEVIDTYSISSTEYATEWEKVYDQRCVLLSLFVDKYGLKVAPKYQGALDEILKNSNSVTENTEKREAIDELVSSMEFEKSVDEFGSVTYSAIAENTTNFNFGYVFINLSLYDAEGVKLEETGASTSSWGIGEKVRFEAYSSVDAQDVKVSVGSYDVMD